MEVLANAVFYSKYNKLVKLFSVRYRVQNSNKELEVLLNSTMEASSDQNFMCGELQIMTACQFHYSTEDQNSDNKDMTLTAGSLKAPRTSGQL